MRLAVAVHRRAGGRSSSSRSCRGSWARRCTRARTARRSRGQGVDARAGRPAVAVGAEMVRAQGVDGDEDDVQRVAGGGGRRGRRRGERRVGPRTGLAAGGERAARRRRARASHGDSSVTVSRRASSPACSSATRQTRGQGTKLSRSAHSTASTPAGPGSSSRPELAVGVRRLQPVEVGVVQGEAARDTRSAARRSGSPPRRDRRRCRAPGRARRRSSRPRARRRGGPPRRPRTGRRAPPPPPRSPPPTG